MEGVEERLRDLQRRVDSGDPLTEDEERYLLTAIEQLLAKAERQEALLKQMQRGKYGDMLLSGLIGWLIGFVLALLLRALGFG